jgi:hypothetical protein
MKLDPGMHIIMHLVSFGKSGVTMAQTELLPSPHEKGNRRRELVGVVVAGSRGAARFKEDEGRARAAGGGVANGRGPTSVTGSPLYPGASSVAAGYRGFFRHRRIPELLPSRLDPEAQPAPTPPAPSHSRQQLQSPQPVEKRRWSFTKPMHNVAEDGRSRRAE